jgi:hypothetical protein
VHESGIRRPLAGMSVQEQPLVVWAENLPTDPTTTTRADPRPAHHG